jgi:bifunctional DNA-binding transcriptional regulator/antitoxin component of YhaV-PrlF toxin-antitoxin module
LTRRPPSPIAKIIQVSNFRRSACRAVGYGRGQVPGIILSRVRAQLPLAVGDVLETTVESETIVLRPKALVDRAALAQLVGRALAETVPLSEDAARSEDKLMAVAVEEVAAVRAGRRSAKC